MHSSTCRGRHSKTQSQVCWLAYLVASRNPAAPATCCHQLQVHRHACIDRQRGECKQRQTAAPHLVHAAALDGAIEALHPLAAAQLVLRQTRWQTGGITNMQATARQASRNETTAAAQGGGSGAYTLGMRQTAAGTGQMAASCKRMEEMRLHLKMASTTPHTHTSRLCMTE